MLAFANHLKPETGLQLVLSQFDRLGVHSRLFHVRLSFD